MIQIPLTVCIKDCKIGGGWQYRPIFRAVVVWPKWSSSTTTMVVWYKPLTEHLTRRTLYADLAIKFGPNHDTIQPWLLMLDIV